MGGGISSSYHCVMIGLDGSGKTRILYRLKYGQYTRTIPTIGFNCEKIHSKSGSSNRSTFNLWDIGGADKTRPLWRSYTRCTDAIIFVVDCTDRERMEEAKLELIKIAKLTERYSIPIMVMANKQDLPSAVDQTTLEKGLGLKNIGSHVGWAVRFCCAVTGEGLEEALDDVLELIENKRTKVNKFLAAGKGKVGKGKKITISE
jgi:small GTP-binding protein